MSKFTNELLDKISELIKPTILPFDHEDIDKFVSNGGDIKNAMIVHSFPEIKDHHYIMTKYGAIGFEYNHYLPPKSMWIINKIKRLELW